MGFSARACHLAMAAVAAPRISAAVAAASRPSRAGTAVDAPPRMLFLGGVDESTDGQDAAVWTSLDGETPVRERSASFGGTGDQLVTSISTDSEGALVVGFDSRAGTRDAAVWPGVLSSGAAGG